MKAIVGAAGVVLGLTLAALAWPLAAQEPLKGSAARGALAVRRSLMRARSEAGRRAHRDLGEELGRIVSALDVR